MNELTDYMKNLSLILISLLLIYSCSSGDDESTTVSSPNNQTSSSGNDITTDNTSDNSTDTSSDNNSETVKFNLTVTAGEGGTISTQGGTYNQGTEVSIIATGNEGYEFLGWEGSDETSSTITITITTNLSLQANFKQIVPPTNYYISGELISDNTNGAWFDRSLTVNGLKLVIAGAVGGQDAVPDKWAKKTAQLVKLLTDPSATGIDKDAQINLIKTLKGETGTWHAGLPTAQRIGYGGGDTYSPNPLKDEGIPSYQGYIQFLNTHEANDMVWYKNVDSSGTGDDDINEIVEHIFHTIHLFGVRGGVQGSEDALNWSSEVNGFMNTSLWLAMKQAIDNGVYGVSDYGNGDPTNPDLAEVMMKEYMYLLNFNMWEFGKEFWVGGTLAPEWNDNSRSPQSIQTNNPLGYSLFNDYFAPVLSKPSIEILRSMFQDNDQGESGYVAD